MQRWLSDHQIVNFKDYLEHFVGYAKANGKTYVDWEQALQNAIRDDWAGLKKVNGKAGSPPWYSSDSGIQQKGSELGLQPKAGESWQQFRGRINAKLA